MQLLQKIQTLTDAGLNELLNYYFNNNLKCNTFYLILLWEDCGNSAAIKINLHMKGKKQH